MNGIRLTEQCAMKWKLEWLNNARWLKVSNDEAMRDQWKLRMTEQYAINGNENDETMRNEWKLEWHNNARSMEIRMNEYCAIKGN